MTYDINVSSNAGEKCEKRLPNCLIIGVQKAGTKALLVFLSAHPQVIRNENISEYHFFDWHYHEGLEWYRDQMPCGLVGQIVIEKSPSYFRNPNVPKRVFEMNPKINLLLIVRDPVRRAVSEYYMQKERYKRQQEIREKRYEQRKNDTDRHGQNLSRPINLRFQSFESSWHEYIQAYDVDFEKWLIYFKSEQIYVVDWDKFARSPDQELARIEQFLKIGSYFNEDMFFFNQTKGFYCLLESSFGGMHVNDRVTCLEKTKGRQYPTVSPAITMKMKSILRPHNKMFYKLIGKHFDWD